MKPPAPVTNTRVAGFMLRRLLAMRMGMWSAKVVINGGANEFGRAQRAQVVGHLSALASGLCHEGIGGGCKGNVLLRGRSAGLLARRNRPAAANGFSHGTHGIGPQRLKPTFGRCLCGTAEAVPFHRALADISFSVLFNSEEQTGKYRAALRSSFRPCTSPDKDVAQQNPLRSSLPGGPRPSWLSLPTPQHSADRKPTLSDLQQPNPELPRCLQQRPVRHRPQPPAESWEMAHTSGSERQGSAHFASALAYRPRSNAQAA